MQLLKRVLDIVCRALFASAVKKLAFMIFWEIIKCFMGDESDLLDKMEEVDLVRHLRKILLDGDKYLAVIDDIWDIEVWKRIKDAFPDKKNSSRIIITTRNKEVAHGVDDRCFAHELRFLREDESWELFCKVANPTRNLEELGREMMVRCGGLPLAIVVLSGLLVGKSYEDWSKVNDHLWTRLKGKSVEIQEILSLSYDDLSFQMRQCFLYLARFPEDHTFNVEKLMRLWVAEEFISEAGGDGRLMEDVAEDYLNELINRNMIQVATLHWHGGVDECRVHDLVRDLATQKATEDKLLGVFDSTKQHPSHIHLLQGQPRHAIYNGIGEYLELLGSSSNNSMLRSLALTYRSQKLFKLEEMKLTCTRFINLKVLDLNSVKSQRLPQEIGDLVLLKFLGLTRSYGCPYVAIPPSIGKLKKLQTLCGSDGITYTFPREICELQELRHLGCLSYDVGRLNISSYQTELQSLGTIEYNEWIEIDTLGWSNLRALCITVDGVQKEQGGNFVHNLDSVANLTNLQSFNFYFFTVPSDVYEVCYGVPHEITTRVVATLEPLSSCKRLKNVYLYGEIKDPSELRFLPHSVTNLKLKGSRFGEDPLATLENLPNLSSLILDEVYSGKNVMCCNDAFPSLHLFYLKNMPRLEELQVDDGALRFLKTFRKYNCVMLKVPPRIKCLSSIPDIYYLVPKYKISFLLICTLNKVFAC